MSDAMGDAVKKMKNTQQDAEAKAETTEDHAGGKPSSETPNKAKEKVNDAFSLNFFKILEMDNHTILRLLSK